MVDVPTGAAEVDVAENALDVVNGVTDWLVNSALVILLVMRVVGAEVGDGRFGALIAGEDVDEMLIGLLTAVALERDADVPPLVLMALTLLGDEDTDAS
jgi:hypothetical protein